MMELSYQQEGDGAAAPSGAQGFRRWLRLAALVTLSSIGIVLASATFVKALAGLPLHDEVGNGDTYVMYDVRHFVETGVIYRKAEEPPHNPVLYGPALYLLLSLPTRIGAVVSPDFLPRLLILTAFLACVATASSITLKLTRSRAAAGLTAAALLCTHLFLSWTVLLRGDFPGLLLGLAAVRLLPGSQSRVRTCLAGLLAGMGLLFKMTFVAVPVAVVVWLAWRRQYLRAGLFAVIVAITGIGGYALTAFFQPELPAHMTALMKPVIDNSGALHLMGVFLREPMVLVAFAGLAIVFRRRRTYWALISGVTGLSLLVNVYVVRQSGASINYFFEAAIWLSPFCAIALLRLLERIPRQPRLAVAVVVVGVVFLAQAQLTLRGTVWTFRQVLHGKDDSSFQAFTAAIRRHNVFSAVSRFSPFSAKPPLITEPYLVSFLETAGTFNTAPIAARVAAGEFEAVIARPGAHTYRTVPFIGPQLLQAISQTYVPYCQFQDVGVWRRASGIDPQFAAELQQAGCVPDTSKLWLPR